MQYSHLLNVPLSSYSNYFKMAAMPKPYHFRFPPYTCNLNVVIVHFMTKFFWLLFLVDTVPRTIKIITNKFPKSS